MSSIDQPRSKMLNRTLMSPMHHTQEPFTRLTNIKSEWQKYLNISSNASSTRSETRRRTVINSSIKLVRFNIPANRSRHSLQRGDKITFYDSWGEPLCPILTNGMTQDPERKIGRFEIILLIYNIWQAFRVAKEGRAWYNSLLVGQDLRGFETTMDKSICPPSPPWCFSWIGESLAQPWSICFRTETNWPPWVCFPSCWKNKRETVVEFPPHSKPPVKSGNLRSSWISIMY